MIHADLATFLKYDGVLTIFLVREGAVLEKTGSPGTDIDGLVASLSLLMTESGIIADILRTQSVPTVFLEFETRLVLIQPLEDHRFVAIVTRTDANIGQISYRLKKMKEEFEV
jgi:predicted regulator of Ras-like GTPase activity (Roadblock/LC7/MglB family)